MMTGHGNRYVVTVLLHFSKTHADFKGGLFDV